MAAGRATIRRWRMIASLAGLIPGLLVVGAAIVALVARYRPRFIHVTAVAVSALAFLLWLVLRFALPVLPGAPAPAVLPPLSLAWRVDQWTWPLGGAWLLLLAGLLVWRLAFAAEAAHGRWPADASFLLLGGIALAAVWAGSPALTVAAWLLLAGAWALVAGPELDGSRLRRSLFWLLPGAFLVWWGAMLGAGAEMGAWPMAARTAVLLGVVVQMGAFPFVGWRVLPEPIKAETAVLLTLTPSMAGAALLLRLVTTGATPQILLVTLAGLVGLLLALGRATTHLGQPRPLAADLALGQTSLLLLAGVWAGPAALVAEGRVLLFALGSLFLLSSLSSEGAPGRLGQALPWAALLPALAALAGWPLTAGWNGRAALYDAWLGSRGGWVLVLVTALLHVGLVTAVFLTLRTRLGRPTATSAATGAWPWPVVVTGGLWTVGLLAVPAWTANLLIWTAVLLPALGLLLPRWLRGEALASWQQAMDGRKERERPLPLVARGRAVLRLAVAALQEAATLPEGVYGLLGLLLLLAIFLLVT